MRVVLAAMRYPLLIALLVVAGCRSTPPADHVDAAISPDSLHALAIDRNYPLLERTTRSDSSAAALAYRAMALHRLGHDAEAERTAAAAVAAMLPDSLLARVAAMRVQNAARKSDYDAAVRLIDQALATGVLDSTSAANLANERLLWAALEETPPVEAGPRPGRTAVVQLDRVGLRRIEISIAGQSAEYVLDTGANLGVMIQSEVERLGLTARPSGVQVGTVTAARVPADITVASVELAGTPIPDVPFLVFADSAMAFPQIDYQIEGVIGLPVLRALGAFRLPAGEGVIEIVQPGTAPETPTLFMDGFTLESRLTVSFGEPRHSVDVTCVVDTGAPETSLSPSFYHRHAPHVEAAGRRSTRQFAGAGGATEIDVWVIPEVLFTVGGAAVALDDVPVETGDDREGAACRLGLDVLNARGGAVFDFEAAQLLLEVD